MEDLHIQDNPIKPVWWPFFGVSFLILFLTLAMSASCNNSDKNSDSNEMVTSTVTVEELYKLSQADSTLFLLDVRTPGEFMERRVTFASALIPFDQLEENKALLPTDSTTPIYCFCRTGRRSDVAMHTLSSLGYTTVYNVIGGIVRWEEIGYPITNGPYQR